MNTAFRVLFLCFVLTLTGCGRAAPPSPEPLLFGDWQSLPREQKYQTDTLERLKKSDPKYEALEVWDVFVRSTILPSRQRDFPYGEGKS
jgi:hypothetical protein